MVDAVAERLNWQRLLTPNLAQTGSRCPYFAIHDNSTQPGRDPASCHLLTRDHTTTTSAGRVQLTLFNFY